MLSLYAHFCPGVILGEFKTAALVFQIDHLGTSDCNLKAIRYFNHAQFPHKNDRITADTT